MLPFRRGYLKGTLNLMSIECLSSLYNFISNELIERGQNRELECIFMTQNLLSVSNLIFFFKQDSWWGLRLFTVSFLIFQRQPDRVDQIFQRFKFYLTNFEYYIVLSNCLSRWKKIVRAYSQRNVRSWPPPILSFIWPYLGQQFQTNSNKIHRLDCPQQAPSGLRCAWWYKGAIFGILYRSRQSNRGCIYQSANGSVSMHIGKALHLLFWTCSRFGFCWSDSNNARRPLISARK